MAADGFRADEDLKQQLVEQAQKAIQIAGFRMQRDVTNATVTALRRRGGAIDKMGLALKNGMEENLKAAKITQSYERIATKMRQGLMDGYQSAVEGQRKVQPYRVGAANRLSGRLGKALARKDMVEVTDDGIRALNQDVLNKEAAHWARLNFGAGGKAGRGASPYFGTLRIGSTKVGQIGFSAKPRPAMLMPDGFWQNAGGERFPWARQSDGSIHEFYLSKKSRTADLLTEGIAARYYTNGMIRAMEEAFPVEMTALVERWKGDMRSRAGKKVREAFNV